MCLCSTANKEMFCSKCYDKNYFARSGSNHVKEILNKHIEKTSLRKTAKHFELAPSTIHRILKGLDYKTSTYFKIINKTPEGLKSIFTENKESDNE